AGVITDRDLVKGGLALGEVDGDLGLDAEAVAANRNAARERKTEGFVTSLHVGEIDIGGHVAGGREDVIGERVPVVDHAPLAGDQEAGAVDHVGAIGNQRSEDLRVFGGVVLQVGVL